MLFIYEEIRNIITQISIFLVTLQKFIIIFMSNKVTKAELSEFKKDKDHVKEYSNGEITVYWKAELCIHSANCLMGMPRVFNNKRKPWINVTGADSKEIMKTVDSCPSRALTYLKSSAFSIRRPRKKKKLIPKFAKIQILKRWTSLGNRKFHHQGFQKKRKSG